VHAVRFHKRFEWITRHWSPPWGGFLHVGQRHPGSPL